MTPGCCHDDCKGEIRARSRIVSIVACFLCLPELCNVPLFQRGYSKTVSIVACFLCLLLYNVPLFQLGGIIYFLTLQSQCFPVSMFLCFSGENISNLRLCALHLLAYSAIPMFLHFNWGKHNTLLITWLPSLLTCYHWSICSSCSSSNYKNTWFLRVSSSSPSSSQKRVCNGSREPRELL